MTDPEQAATVVRLVGMAKPPSTDQAARKANDAIHKLTIVNYFRDIPLADLFQIVEQAGFTLDPEQKECFLAGRQGKASWDLFFNGKPANRVLVLTWHKMDVTGRWEVVSYVS